MNDLMRLETTELAKFVNENCRIYPLIGGENKSLHD